jgi:hypothetical protein
MGLTLESLDCTAMTAGPGVPAGVAAVGAVCASAAEVAEPGLGPDGAAGNGVAATGLIAATATLVGIGETAMAAAR